jgi:hypothetical protein
VADILQVVKKGHVVEGTDGRTWPEGRLTRLSGVVCSIKLRKGCWQVVWVKTAEVSFGYIELVIGYVRFGGLGSLRWGCLRAYFGFFFS